MKKNIQVAVIILFIIQIFGTHKVEASYGGLDWVVVTGPNQITATFEHSLASYDASSYTNLGLGLAGRNIVDVAATTSNTITLDFDGPSVPPNTTGTVDIGPVDWADAPGGFAGGTGYPVDDGQTPKLGAVTLQDLDNSGGLSYGDTLSFLFDEPMRQDITTDNIDSYFSLGEGRTFGTAANGLALSWNRSSTTLTVTLGSDAALAPGDMVYPLSAFSDLAGNIMNNMPPPLEIPFIKTTPRTLYFYSTSTYADWTNINNWWDDSLHTIQASSTPSAYDDVVIDSTVAPYSDTELYVHSVVFSSVDSVDQMSMPLNFFYAYIIAPGGITVNNNWNILGYFIGDVSFNQNSAAGFPFFSQNNFATYFSVSDIIGNVRFNGPSNANYGTIYGTSSFYGGYGNAGLIYGDTDFNDGTSNPGIIFGNAVFRDNSGYAGMIHGNVDVYSPVENPITGAIDGTVTYHGYNVDGGSGTELDPYRISNCSQLQSVSGDLSLYYKLTADIDCSSTSGWNSNVDEWVDGNVGGELIPDSYASTTHTDIIVQNNGYFGFEPIGTQSTPFTGSFDADGHTISNLWIFRKNTNNVGLFGYTHNATIKNLNLSDSHIVGGGNTGGVVGTMDGGQSLNINLNNNMVRAYLSSNGGGFAGSITSGSLDNINNNSGYVHGSGNVIGGVIGYMQNGTVANSYSNASVDGGLMIGGFVGEMDNGQITNSHSTGLVTSNRSEWVVMKTGFFAGGFVAYMGSGNISNSYATGDVHSSGSYAGGFVGFSNPSSIISQSYATGDVSGNQEVFQDITFTPEYVGGFVGVDIESNFSQTYATGNVTADGDYAGGYAGFIGDGIIHDAYVSGSVAGQGYVGGFAGEISPSTDIQNVYARGAATSTHQETTNGLIGVADNDIIPTNSFWDINTVGQPSQSSSAEKTTEQMTDKSTYTDAGWNFDTIWYQNNNLNSGYPVLMFSMNPEVSSVSPVDGSTGISATSSIVIHFSVPMNTDSVIISTSTCGYACSSYTQDWSDNNKTLTLTKTGDPFVDNSTYTISILSANSFSGIALNDPYTWSFTIGNTAPQTQNPVAGGLINMLILNNTNKNTSTVPVVINNIVGTSTVYCNENIYPTEIIKLGSKNDPEQVKLLQEYLNTYENAQLPVTGIYSEKDRDAVIAWQEKHASDILTPWHLNKGTGYVYKTSLQKFKNIFLSQCVKSSQPDSLIPSSPSLTRDLESGMSGKDVFALQNALISKNTGPAARALAKYGANGYFGRLTKSALIEFQKSNKISPANGKYGPKTRLVLNF